MALFKILKGKSSNLGSSGGTNKTTQGYAYFTPDDGKFYIDVRDNEDPVIGNNEDEYVGEKRVNRICINQRVFTYNDYDILDCGTAAGHEDSENVIIFNCGTSL